MHDAVYQYITYIADFQIIKPNYLIIGVLGLQHQANHDKHWSLDNVLGLEKS